MTEHASGTGSPANDTSYRDTGSRLESRYDDARPSGHAGPTVPGRLSLGRDGKIIPVPA